MLKIILFVIVTTLSQVLFAMGFDDFNFISGLFHSGKLAERMNCSLKVRELKEDRKFSDGHKFVEYLKINFTTGHLGPRSVEFSVSMNAKINKTLKNYADWGTVEELKVDLEDEKSSVMTLLHTGDRIVYFELVNELSIYLCGIKPGF